MPTLQPSGDMLGMNMMLTCRAGVPEMPNAQELFWCWRKASHHLRKGIEGLLMQITQNIEATHGKDASLKWSIAYEEALRELYLPYEWDEMCGPMCGDAAGDEGDDCTYSEHEPSSWMYLGAEDEHEWVTCNHKEGRSGGKQLAALLEKLVDHFGRTAAPILSKEWAGLLLMLCAPLQDWQVISDALLSEDTAALQASLKGGHSPFTIVAQRMVHIWGACFGEWTDPDTRRPLTKVFEADKHAILDQTVGAAWRCDPFVRRWQGNALMYYPLRIFSDRAWASLFLWLDAGVTPLQALRADWLKRPEQHAEQ